MLLDTFVTKYRVREQERKHTGNEISMMFHFSKDIYIRQ